MADDFGDKTEAPTPRKRQEARDQGKVARSRDLANAVLIIGSMVLLKNFGGPIRTALETLVKDTLGERMMGNLSGPATVTASARAVIDLGVALAPVLVGLVLMVIAVDLMQVGLVFNGKRLQPNLAALNPVKGFGRLFGKDRTPMQGAIALVKLVVIGLVAYSAIHERLPLIVFSQKLEFIQIFGLGAETVYQIGIRIGVVLLVLALIDYGYQRWKMEQDLKMTKQEVKDEMRRMDGDPLIKQRRRQMAMQRMKEQLQKEVPTADVIVTNPTHFAVALKYDEGAMHAPRVIAKGQDFIALKIREIAVAGGVPILERPPLARALYKLVDVGQEIPEQYYAAVAEILAYVYELSGKARRRVAS